MTRRTIAISFWTLLFLSVLAPSHLDAASKLYLKDGTYQLVKSYEVKGDRVRYYSVERSEWEEIPTALVDFDATHRAEQQEQAVKAKQLQEAKQIEQKHISQQMVANGFPVAPGVRLPQDQGLFAFDGTLVIPLVQSDGDEVQDRKRMALNLAVPAPLLKRRLWVVLAGPKAAIRFHNVQPTFYAQFPDSTAANLQLIPVKSTKQDRVVENVDVGLKGKPTESRVSIPIRRTQVAPGVYKLEPAKPLGAGEYAFGEIKNNKMNLDVWDFGIDPAR
ncbi:MAG TPA: hypothetical protein VMX16_18865 [Terriglobia bacterium]|nr:hypothetical protein [Terriglobia bacterium]